MAAHFIDLTNSHGLLSSGTVEVLAESGKKRFFVHSNILAAQLGATGKKMDLSRWDGDTVERFLQFFYIGDYQFSASVLKEAGANEKEENKETREDEKSEERGEENKGEEDGSRSSKGMERDEDTTREDRDGDECEKRDGFKTPNTAQSQAAREGCSFEDTDSNILLVHAKVYALAQHKGAKALQTMALGRLGMTLGGIGQHMPGGTAASVVELLEYVYSHTDLNIHADTDTDPEEPMRSLVLSFMVENLQGLMCRKEIELFLRKGGDFVVDLMRTVSGGLYGKLRETEQKVQDWKNQVTALDKRIREVEIDKAEKIAELEAVSKEKLQEFEVNSAEKIRELEAVISENVKKLSDMDDDWYDIRDESTGRLKELNASKKTIQQLKDTNEKTLAQLEASEERVQRWVEWSDTFKARYAKKKRELKAADERVEELEEEQAEIEATVEELEAANEKLREWEEWAEGAPTDNKKEAPRPKTRNSEKKQATGKRRGYTR